MGTSGKKRPFTQIEILKTLRNKSTIGVSDLKNIKRSRQKLSKHLNRLVKEGLLYKEGSTRKARYGLESSTQPKREKRLVLIKTLKNLKESIVYEEVEAKLDLQKVLNENTQNILFYAFTEMLNNAIDHSCANKAQIEITLEQKDISFKIRDQGIGIFKNVMQKFKLNDEFEGLEHVLKGKQTTYPEHHSGEGIFFTSRIADVFKIRSHKLEVTKNNLIDDMILKDIRNIQGTEVSFQISLKTKQTLKKLFRKYTNDDYEFDRTSVKVNLTAERTLLSRSQAKRILFGLETYKVITLDFKKVKEIGQGFVDEVFPIF